MSRREPPCGPGREPAPDPAPGPAESAVDAASIEPLTSGRVSDHLRALRSAVPGEHLFAPRVALLLASSDGERVVVDEGGDLPWADVEIETSLEATARGLLAGLDGEEDHDDATFEPVAALAGMAWWETSPLVGRLAPVWIVVRVTGADRVVTASRTQRTNAVRLAQDALARERGEGAADAREGLERDGGADYIARVRRHIGHDRIFYPWAGMAIRDDAGRVLLVRHALLQQWHCPGGGLEVAESPEMTAARELREETSLSARPGRLLGCFSRHVRAFPNGDRIQGVAIFLEGTAGTTELRPDPTGEIDAMGWFAPDELPPLHPPWDRRVRLALTGEGSRLD